MNVGVSSIAQRWAHLEQRLPCGSITGESANGCGTLKRVMTYTWDEQPSAEWLEQQKTMQAHLLQHREWGEFQVALGRKVFYSHGKGWNWLAILEKTRFSKRLYCPYGPTVTSTASLRTALEVLVACGKSLGVTYIRIEPQGPLKETDLRRLRLQPAHRDIQPHYTWVKDLRSDEATLLAEMSATNRNLYRTANNKNISFRISTTPKDVSIFLDMMHEVAGRNSITIHSDRYYEIMTKTLMPLGALKLYIAEHEGTPVATSLVLDSPSTRYYAHAASHAAARKLHPGTPLLAHMIFDAKLDGKTSFDFYGIAPPDQPNHRWAGFTQFKQSFGGHVVDMHGTWEFPCNFSAYMFYRIVTRAKRAAKKLTSKQ